LLVGRGLRHETPLVPYELSRLPGLLLGFLH
jgi:hypothetical protein